MKIFKIGASTMFGTYSAGVFCAETAEAAIEQAKQAYRNSTTGRALNDVGAFRFYVRADERPEDNP